MACQFKSSTEERAWSDSSPGPGSLEPEGYRFQRSASRPHGQLRLKWPRSRSPGQKHELLLAAFLGCLLEKAAKESRKQKKVQLTRAVNVATQDAAREAKKGKPWKTISLDPSSEPDEGDEDPRNRSQEFWSLSIHGDQANALILGLDLGSQEPRPVLAMRLLNFGHRHWATSLIQPEGTCKVYNHLLHQAKLVK